MGASEVPESGSEPASFSQRGDAVEYSAMEQRQMSPQTWQGMNESLRKS